MEDELEILKKELLVKEKEINRLTAKGLAVTKELSIIQSNDSVNAQMAELNYTLIMAQKLTVKHFQQCNQNRLMCLLKLVEKWDYSRWRV